MDIKEIAKSISDLVKTDSSQKEPAPGAPFGKGARKVLDEYLALASSFGFETKDYEGYAGEVTVGEGEDFAILVHLDVVPAGDGWIHDPFGGEIDSEGVWGRGTIDDKGPAVIALYALKSLKDEGCPFNRCVKLIAGCNEESGQKCMEYYNAHAKMPDEGISPDADFPVIYAEKGILQVELSFPPIAGVTYLEGGNANNIVCDRVDFIGPVYEDRIETLHFTRVNEYISSQGKSAHASTPEMGRNAIAPVLRYLGETELEKALFETYFGLKGFEDETGPLTFSPDVIEQTDDALKILCDIRYPATMKEADILAKLDEAGVSYKIVMAQDPLYCDKKSPLVQTLCSVYNEVTGQSLEPVAIGGGTYARQLKRGAAFGPEEPGEDLKLHGAEERITFEKIERCFKIYKTAIERIVTGA